MSRESRCQIIFTPVRLPVFSIGSIPVSEGLRRESKIHQEYLEGRLFAQRVEVVVAESVI